jgi:hypothetical protein
LKRTVRFLDKSLQRRITVNDLFGKVIFSKDILPITVKEWQSRKIKLIPLSRNWVNSYMQGVFPKNMYSNWLRHFDMNFLMHEQQEGKPALAFHLIQAFMVMTNVTERLFIRILHLSRMSMYSKPASNCKIMSNLYRLNT